jgi:hypothetical protein
MAEQFQLNVFSQLGDELLELERSAKADPEGEAATKLAAAKAGLRALRDGRESEYGAKKFRALVDQYGDIGDCAEIKIPVVQEYAPNGYAFGPSHRMTYRDREAASGEPGSVPLRIRDVIAFEPRKDGTPFRVTAERLNRSVGTGMDGLNSTQTRNSTTAQPRISAGPEVREIPPTVDPDVAAAARLASASFGRPATEARRTSPTNGAAEPSRDQVSRRDARTAAPDAADRSGGR